MMDEAETIEQISPEIEQAAAQVARDRAQAAKWDLDIALLLFAVLMIIITLLFQGLGLGVVAPVAIFGLTLAWLRGWRRGQQAYRRFYDEEISKVKRWLKRRAEETVEDTVEEAVQKALRERWR